MKQTVPSSELIFYAFVFTIAAGPLDHFVNTLACPPFFRTIAWVFIYLGFMVLTLYKTGLWRTSIEHLWPLFIVPLYALISVAWSIRPLATLDASLQFFAILYFGAIIGQRLDERQILKLLVISLVVLTLFDYAQTALSSTSTDNNGDVIGIFSHKNTNGKIMAIASLGLLSLLMFTPYNLWLKLLLFICLGGCLFMLFQSGSRTSWIGCMTGIISLALVALLRLKPAFRLMLLLSIILGVSLAVFTILTLNIDPVEGTLSLMNKDPSLTGRTYLWDLGRRIAERNPILGQGYGSFWHDDVYSESSFVNAAIKDTLGSFHNGFLEARVELGWVGCAIEALFLLSALLPISRLLKHGDRSAAAFTLAFFVQAVVINLDEVAIFVRHGFELLILASLWGASLRYNRYPNPLKQKSIAIEPFRP